MAETLFARLRTLVGLVMLGAALLSAAPLSAHILAARGLRACEIAPFEADGPAALPALPDGMIPEMLDWIAATTDYDVTATRKNPPRIEFCTEGETIAYEGEDILISPDLHGVYDLHADSIVIVLPWDPASVFDRSVLLHELIHHVQLQNRSWECLQAPEWEAYKHQETWLGERGVAAEFNWFMIYFLSRCPRDHHP